MLLSNCRRLGLFILCWGGMAVGQTPAEKAGETPTSQASRPAFDHSVFDALLKKHVRDNGRVDYEGLRTDAAQLDSYLAGLADAPYEKLPRDEQMALLINAYNACTLRLVLDYWPLQSIKDIPEEKRWKDRRWKIGGMTLSLDDMENEFLRRKFDDPRVHFAINCASTSCPPLRAEAYSPVKLEQQLEAQAKSVHGDERWLKLDDESGVVYLTPLYEWYATDFVKDRASALDYAARFNAPLAKRLKAKKPPRIEWTDYDWSLNDSAGRR